MPACVLKLQTFLLLHRELYTFRPIATGSTIPLSETLVFAETTIGKISPDTKTSITDRQWRGFAGYFSDQ